MGKIVIDIEEFQKKIIECITSKEVDKYFEASTFASSPENQHYKQAMIYGMAIASMMTSSCGLISLEERPLGHWALLDDCANEGVYCSICNKKVYKKPYANQKVRSKFCPNCGAKMHDK